MSGRPRSCACLATARAPLRVPASTMTVPAASAAMTRARAWNRSLLVSVPGGASLTTAPCAAMALNRSACAAG